jgi:predicted ATPase
VAELPPQEARGRFQLVFRRFLGAFARPEHPLALFLDDLQWLDTATLELLERMVTDSDVRHVLLIGAYRDNEVSSSHPLMRTLAAIRSDGARVQEIVLAPLGLDDVERLVTDALRCGPDSAGPLALLVYEKTGGNPFFAIQFLMTVAEEGLLRFDRNSAAWIWELTRIYAKSYSDNVVDLMLGKLRRLPHRTQTALQQLACLGNAADMALLSLAFGQSQEEIHAPLWDAVRRVDSSFGGILRIPPRPDSAGGVRTHPGKGARRSTPSDWPRIVGEPDSGRSGGTPVRGRQPTESGCGSAGRSQRESARSRN